MNEEEFWDLIEESRGRLSGDDPDGNLERQADDIRRLLAARDPGEVIVFRDRLVELLHRAYTYDLWGAACVIAGSCSDDWFDYFRYWLVSLGRHPYTNAIEDAESLVGPATAPDVEDVFFEDLGGIPDHVYGQQTGRAPPPYPGDRPASPCGERWRDEAELADRYPRLWERFRK